MSQSDDRRDDGGRPDAGPEAGARLGSNVTLEPLSDTNRGPVALLRLDASQQRFVASNEETLAEIEDEASSIGLVIASGGVPVGLLAYEVFENRDGDRGISIFRLMIDRCHQRRGYARQALTLFLRELSSGPDRIGTVRICYLPDNDVSRVLYASLGFAEIGLDEDGEIIAQLAV